MKVLLIYPYFQTGKNQDILFHPLGIALLSARLKEMGIDVMKLDCTFMTIEEALSIASGYRADITGIYVMTTMSKGARELLDKMIQSDAGGMYVAGGPLPTLYPSEFAEQFDFVFRGEASVSFPDFCWDHSRSESQNDFLAHLEPGRYPGIFSKKYGPMDEPVMHLSELELNAQPNPDRSGFDHETYQKLSREKSGKKTASMMLTFGCPYHCDFCSKPIFGDQLRYRILDKIFEEIRDIISLGYDALWIADDTFTCDEVFLKQFCLRMIQENLGIAWSCLSRVDGMQEESYALMKRSGCQKVYLGIESGNDQVLKMMNKGTDTTMIRKAVMAFQRNGLACSGFFIVGYPGESLETIEETFEFAKSLGLSQVSFNVPYPLPGSQLYDRVHIIGFKDWTFENETRFLYESEFDAAWLQKRILETTEAVNGRRG